MKVEIIIEAKNVDLAKLADRLEEVCHKTEGVELVDTIKIKE